MAFNTATREILFGECNWSNKPLGLDILSNLKKKACVVDWFKNQRTEYFLLISKSDFTDQLKQVAREEGILLALLDIIDQPLNA